MDIPKMRKKYGEIAFIDLGRKLITDVDSFTWYSHLFQRFLKFNVSEIWWDMEEFEEDFWKENDKQKRKHPEYALDDPEEYLKYLKFLKIG